MDNLKTEAPRGRGRPRKEIQGHVIRDLMNAAEIALANKTGKELTVHEIASAACVNDAMIHYYFGGKDGLLVAILHEIMKDAPYRRSDKIKAQCIAEESIRPLICELVEFYYSRNVLVRMIKVELFTVSSKVYDVYNKKYFDVTPALVKSVVESLIETGIYSKNYNSTFVNALIFSMTFGQIILFGVSDLLHMPEKASEWADDITRLIDSAMKPSRSDKQLLDISFLAG